MKSFLIVGMGTFGHHLCRFLSEQHCEIMVVDSSQEQVGDLLDIATSVKIGDCTKVEVLDSFDIPSFDACFVCIGNDFQNSLEVTSLLKELGAKRVFSKAEKDVQAKFLLRNGADEVIYPELDVARSLAVSVNSDGIFDYIPMGDEFSIAEISVSDKWVGKSILELNFRGRYHLSILAIKKNGELLPLPPADYVFEPNVHIMVLGKTVDIQKAV